jgi:hypothetical protein
MSARAPAGNVNKKKGREAAVDNSERNKGDGVIVFITQVAAMSCAETQHPETTLASQSLPKIGFRSATQVEVEVVLIRSQESGVQEANTAGGNKYGRQIDY